MITGNKNQAVEGLRGLASLIVIFHHLVLTFYPALHNYDNSLAAATPMELAIHHSPFGFFFSGTGAVFVFFVLSGYILTHVIVSKPSVIHAVGTMCLKRYLRLMIPVTIICIIAFLCFHWLDTRMDRLPRSMASYGGDDNYSLAAAIYSGMIDTFFISGRSPYNPVLWTMKIELYGSFLVFLLCVLRIKGLANFAGIAFILLFAHLIDTRYYHRVFGLGLIAFVIGYWICCYGKVVGNKAAIIMCVAGLYLTGAHNTSLSYQWLANVFGADTYLLANLAAGILFVYIAVLNPLFGKWLSTRSMAGLGDISFSAYLLHMPVLYVAGLTLFNVLMDKGASYFLAALAASIVTFTVTLWLSRYYARYIDKTSIYLSARFSRGVMSLFTRLSGSQRQA